MSIDVTMPRLSDTMEQGTIIKWNVSEGDEVSSGDVVADVETDKATMELSVFDDGTMAAILVDEGKLVDVGTVIAVLAEEDEDPADVKSQASSGGGASASAEGSKSAASGGDDDSGDDGGGTATAAPPRSAGSDAPAEPSHGTASATSASGSSSGGDDRPGGAGGNGKLRVSPVARRLAEEHDVDLQRLSGSGPNGRIIKRDVLKAAEATDETKAAVPPSAGRAASSGQDIVPAGTASTAPQQVSMIQPVRPAAAHEATGDGPALGAGEVQVSQMRQVIARRLVESKQTIPHYQVSMSFDMEPLTELRKDLNAKLEGTGIKLSVNDFLLRACALAMQDHPDFNASWNGDSIVYHAAVNIGMAVSLPAEKGGGLVVATIRDCDRKSLRTISAETKELAEKARTKGLSVEEMSDSTFTVSNLGMFGVDHFTAIVNPPNSAILAVGGAIEQPVVKDGRVVPGLRMTATLSNDHRVVDGAMAAAYLKSLKGAIENPGVLLV